MIQILGWRDVWSLQAFCMRERERLKAPGLRIIEEEYQHPEYDGGKGWAPLRIAINHAKSIAAKGPLEMVRAELQVIDPKEGDHWWESEFVQVRIGIRCNPAAWICWPPQTFSIQPGQIVLVPAGWQSVVNCGEQQAISLVLSLRMKDPERSRALEGGEVAP
jgi:hypothetical protein